MKFAIINDAHIGPSESGFAKGVRRKLVDQSESILKSIIAALNQTEKPELAINLGDSSLWSPQSPRRFTTPSATTTSVLLLKQKLPKCSFTKKCITLLSLANIILSF